MTKRKNYKAQYKDEDYDQYFDNKPRVQKKMRQRTEQLGRQKFANLPQTGDIETSFGHRKFCESCKKWRSVTYMNEDGTCKRCSNSLLDN